jgi:hypothetical protein
MVPLSSGGVGDDQDRRHGQPEGVERSLRDAGSSRAAVVGVPDEMLGQAIRAFVVREPGGAVSMKVLKHCSENLEPFWSPRRSFGKASRITDRENRPRGAEILESPPRTPAEISGKDVGPQEQPGDKRPKDVVDDIGERGVPGRDHLQSSMKS